MGGYGSGRVGERELITNLRFLNVRWLNKQGLLKSKGVKTLSWSRNGKPWGKMEVLVEEDRIRLIYKVSRNDGPWEDKDVEIKLLKTSDSEGFSIGLSVRSAGAVSAVSICRIRGVAGIVDTWLIHRRMRMKLRGCAVRLLSSKKNCEENTG